MELISVGNSTINLARTRRNWIKCFLALYLRVMGKNLLVNPIYMTCRITLGVSCSVCVCVFVCASLSFVSVKWSWDAENGTVAEAT